MNISYKWLKEYVDFDLTPQQTADALTSIGLEVDSVEEVQSVKGGLKGLVDCLRCAQCGCRSEGRRRYPGYCAL